MIARRRLGRTGLEVPVLGFGCGAVGGLMVRGEAAEQAQAVARAMAIGIDWFDTAASYGDGRSETALGQALRAVGARGARVATKVRVAPGEAGRVAAVVAESLEASLRRLGLERVALFQLHTPITAAGEGGTLTPAMVREEVLPALERLRAQGKCDHLGITAIGEPAALREVIAGGAVATAQVPFNLLNPSAAFPAPAGLVGGDAERLIDHCAEAGVGVFGIRILAGGALSGSAARHPHGSPRVAPIGSGPDYAADVAAARALLPLVAEGFAESLVEAAIRFAITPPGMSSALVGIATAAQFEAAAAAAAKGPLPEAALARLRALQDR
jgi:aryl-alcohol dehydrogenase-like predicted oxidoreductase